ncbi:anti-anti-sigma factor [Saccharothrix saharensis]|uniref:Anti-anti-sigma factor n=1 Tax=Saccharothrix saharensis TaxID=571190 RepID=A0A543J9E0_9PSEU|nr:STAS domain-containing protein [Saccharothrix saharensis]TQM79428.1 anti-anti-sigma factor [Saccharothrix saharensis]
MNPQALQCTLAVLDAHTARIVLSGDIVYDNGDQLLVMVDELLTVHGVRAIRLDCGGIGFCDSYGLSTLLAVRRRVAAAGAQLELDNRRPSLDRLMRRTHTFQHLTGTVARQREEADS